MFAVQSSSDVSEQMESLIAYGVNINKRNKLRQTPLHLTIRASYKAILPHLRVLLKHDASVHIKDNQGSTPLGMEVMSEGQQPMVKIVRLLIAHKADINAREVFSRMPLCAFLKTTAFREARNENAEDIILALANSETDVNIPDDTGRTLLF